ncbi:hypothetical protein CcaverHIS002_0704580 [Cutaneotrichosporon cavernicola]|nr:hypothetical protein CcaverHIS002_0704580 [Cutaneotrichosporon cavernicola]
MGGDLISAAAILQIARMAADAVANLGKSTVLSAALAQEGVDVDVLGRLLGALSIRPRKQYAAALSHAAPLHGRFSSRFLSQVLPESVPTVQQKLAESQPGKALLLLVSGLACAAPSRQILGLLRELLAVSYGLPRVAELSESYLRTCSHAGTMAVISEQVQGHLEWYTLAFDTVGEGARRASARELAAVLLAFGRAQTQEGAYVRIRNLCGLEPLLAALSTLFGATVRVGQLMPRAASLSMVDIAPTEIVCEFGTGSASVALVRLGGPVLEYLGTGGVTTPKSFSCGQMRACARARLARAGKSWAARAAAGAFIARTIAADLAMRAELAMSDEAITKPDVIARDWITEFGHAVNVQSLDPADYESTDHTAVALHGAPPDLVFLLKAAAGSKNAVQLYLACLGDLGVEVQALCDDPEIQSALNQLWLVSYLTVIYGCPVPGLEVRGSAVERWKFPSTVGRMLGSLVVLPAYDGIMGRELAHSRAVAAVQAGAYVLLPRLLAEESVGTLESSLLIMLPGAFRVDKVAVDSFLPDECETVALSDLRDTEPPADASASNIIEYHYAEAETGYALRVLAAGYQLDLAAALKGIMGIRRLHAFTEQVEHTTWLKAAPHHTVAEPQHMSWFQKTVYLSHENEAGRLLAFARVGERRERLKAVFFEGADYRQALAYADRHQCKIVIL